MIRPFSRFCISLGVFPESILKSLSYEEQLLRLIKFIKCNILPSIEGNTKAIEEIENWIETANFQEEINNKLDEMAESGELLEIISKYLNVNSILAFNTINDLKNATNIINGSFARTYGKNSYNDGLGSFYKIRNITSEDIIDEYNIISLEVSDSLVGERLFDSPIGNLNNLKTNNKNSIVDAINEVNKNVLIAIGDSWTSNTNDTSIWKTLISEAYNIEVKNYAVSGSGFIEGGNNKFLNQAQRAVDDNSYDHSRVKYIVVMGGVNDVKYSSAGYSDLIGPIKTVFNYLQNNFKCKIIFIPTYEYPFNRQLILWQQIAENINENNLCLMCDIVPLQNVDHFEDNKFHLTLEGQKMLASNIMKCLSGGKLTSKPYSFTFTNNDIWLHIEQTSNDGIITTSFYGYFVNYNQIKTYAVDLGKEMPILNIDSHNMVATLADKFENEPYAWIEIRQDSNSHLTIGTKGNSSSDDRNDFHITYSYDASNIQL